MRTRRIAVCGLPGFTMFFTYYLIDMMEDVRMKLTLNLLTTTIVALPSNASKWQMVFNSAFRGLSRVHPHPSQQQATHKVLHMTSCILQSNVPEDGHNYCPKHVELNLEF
jgi:hypothetical protein